MMVRDQATEKQEEQDANEVMHYQYELTTTLMIDVAEDMEYTTYGIKVFDAQGDLADEYPDVNTSESFVRAIVKKCNDNRMDVLHLEDILFDEIG